MAIQLYLSKKNLFEVLYNVYLVLWSQAGVNFTNMFTHSFYARRSQKRKKLHNLTVFLALLGSASVKAAHKHVDEIDPRRRKVRGKKRMNELASFYLSSYFFQFKFCVTLMTSFLTFGGPFTLIFDLRRPLFPRRP